MSYKSLLFCPDEKTVRLVTQVLTELDFTVEVAGETYATVKKLGAERVDALVVDCQNEQDATLLFKAARDSKENHGSLAVALVEGQAGVAKAFRIGANLVLMKPINLEQAKGTLRVAQGLLKKNQARTVATSGPITTAPAVLTSAADSLIPSSQAPAGLAGTTLRAPSPLKTENSAHDGPSFSVLEVENEHAPATEASDAAVLESLPTLARNSSLPSTPLGLMGAAPVATGPSGSAAAVAPALEKPIAVQAGAAPLVTNEPIVKEPDAPVVFDAPAATPTFSSLDSQGSRSGAGFLKVTAILLLAVVGGFFGWQKLKPMLHSSMTTDSGNAPASITPPPSQPAASQSSSTTPTPAPAQNVFPPVSDTEPATRNDAEEVVASPSVKPQHVSPDDVQVQEMPLSRDAKITVTPKPQPLVVKTGTQKPSQTSAPLAPPTVDVGAANTSDTIAKLVTSDAVLPKPAPGTIRISQGVSQGLLMKKIAPSYPRMALQLHKEGVVELLATVSKEGRISKVKILSGDAMLTNAAADAVRQWVYRPYLLNGQPLEVETQISVSFKLPK